MKRKPGMQKNLETLLETLRARRVILAFSYDGARLAWKSPDLPPEIRTAIHNKRRALARLMRSGDIRLCPNPDLHRKSWRYGGQGIYTCELCSSFPF